MDLKVRYLWVYVLALTYFSLMTVFKLFTLSQTECFTLEGGNNSGLHASFPCCKMGSSQLCVSADAGGRRLHRPLRKCPLSPSLITREAGKVLYQETGKLLDFRGVL